MAKIREVISDIDEIISQEGERAAVSPELQECRTDLQRLLDELQSPTKVVDPASLIATIYRLVERIASWIDRVSGHL